MQLRDAGELDLDDRLEQHIDGIANGTPTIRRMLAHLSGLQREAGEMFVTGESPTEEQLIDSMSDVEFVLAPGAGAPLLEPRLRAARPGRRAQERARRTREYVDERIIGPLGLARTTWAPQAPQAQGYLVDEYARTVWTRAGDRPGGHRGGGPALVDRRGPRPLGGVPRGGRRGRPRADDVEEMWFPQVMYYPDDWVLGWGLGLMLYNQSGAIYGGHGGAMAGHLAGVYVDRKTQIGAAGADELGHARRTWICSRSRSPRRRRSSGRQPIEAWRPEAGAAAPTSRPLLGRWWSEGNEFLFWWEGGPLRAKFAAAPPGKRRDDVRARRRRLARRRRAASAASGCGSTATG